jgi:hypothetical protein
MFIIDATFEDIRIRAESRDGVSWEAMFDDAFTGKFDKRICTAQQVADIMAINLHIDGMPDGYTQMYERLESILAGLPKETRPVP